MKLSFRFAAVLSAALLLGMTGCKKKDATAAGEEAAKAKPTVRLVYVNWAEGVAMTYLVEAVLEDKMGYDVQLTMADVAPVFTALADGDADAFLDSWLPVTHADYMTRYKDKIVDLGVIYEGARIGLAVPAYMEAREIKDLVALKDSIEGQIVGIDSGAGIMIAAEKAVSAYELPLRLVPSSGPAMTAALKEAIDSKRPVVVTGWKPHWKFARWDLKFLDDPQGVFGANETIHAMARLGLEKDLPEVATFLRTFKLDDQQLGSLMGAVAEAESTPEAAVRGWMKENQELIDGWLVAAQ